MHSKRSGHRQSNSRGLSLSKPATTLDNGVTGRVLTIQSATPISYEQIVARVPQATVELDAELFMPSTKKASPVVILIPGSGGVNPWMHVHARALTDVGIGVFLVDPFGGRGVIDTIAQQQQFSFAASTWDVYAAMHRLRDEPGVNAEAIGAMGYSRGGISVIQATMKPLAEVALQDMAPLKAVLAGWPWCGYQFEQPNTNGTKVRILGADQDSWASVVQAQAYFNAIEARNPGTSIRIFKDAKHGFGYGTAARDFPEAMTALLAPIVYFNEKGVALDLWSKEALPGADDHMLRAMLTKYITRGVSIGTQGTQMQDFIDDFTSYFRANLLS
jgi:dienelactone hydrolase